VESIVIDNKSVFVLTSSALTEYNLQTGLQRMTVTAAGLEMIRLEDGLLISDGLRLALFYDGVPSGCVKCKHHKLVSAEEGNRFLLLTNKGVSECEWPRATWPIEFLNWIQCPEFPFDQQWPQNTSMDALAMTADIWIPKTVYLDLPKQWFRHEELRESIWNAVIANDQNVSYNWLFLTPHIMQQWYQKNIDAVLHIVEDEHFNASAPIILNRVYKHIDILSPAIQKWCWTHHGRIQLTHINTYILQQDSEFLSYISKQPVTSAAATILTTKAVREGLKKEYVSIFIRMLRKYHEDAPCAPTHHMKRIFSLIVAYIYSSLDSTTMSLPLKESGSWVPLGRAGPGHLGALIQQRATDGYITHIDFQPERIQWKPIHSNVELILSSDEPVHIWKYYHDDGPNTMLECALTILSKDIWQTSTRKRPFKWPENEIVALECENISIRVFEEPMRLVSVKWTPESCQIDVSTGMTIDKEEKVHISTVIPLWSYYEDQMYHIIPMKLKICSEIVKTTTRSQVSVKYAKELISVIEPATVAKEHRHDVPQRITAVSKSFDAFFVGLVTGEVLEYESAANFIPMRHFVKHTAPVNSISAFETRLMTVCPEEMNVWSLHSGCLLFSKMTTMIYVSSVRNSETSAWVVEKDDKHVIMRLWDVFEERVVKTETVGTYGDIFITEGPAIITNQKVIVLKDDRREYEIGPTIGSISCVTNTYNGICGGTTLGTVFMVDEIAGDLRQWSSLRLTGISAVAAMDKQPYVITGTDHGELIVWNIDSNDTNIVSITKITSARIDHIFFDNMFAAIIHRQHVQLLSIVQERCILAVNAIEKCMTWSEQWKRRFIRETTSLLQPTVETCILQNSGVGQAMELLLSSTEEYGDRLKWCNRDFIDILVEVDPTLNKLILKRLASFSGPKLECVICNDENKIDRICYLKPCQHRFHIGCIQELIRKLPEYHHEMQQEYALHVTLKCPTCREPFVESDVCEDRFLNQNFFAE
jgi:hypothetical protein